MPVLILDIRLPVCSPGPPPRARNFVDVAVVAVLHHIVDAHGAVTVVVIVGLPQRAEGVDSHFVIIPEVVCQDFEFAPVRITAEDHTLAIRTALLHAIAGHIDYDVAGSIDYLLPTVAKIEIVLPVRTENESMHTVVVVVPTDPR